jgi:hypothetical protein
MEKKSELMKALKELTEKRLLSNEVEVLFEPYKDVVFPLSLSFVSSERSFGSQKDATYNEGYKVICNAENWNVEVTILFAPEDNTLVESYDPGQDFEVNVRFIDYDSLYQRAIFGKLSSELAAPEEEELTAPEEEEVAAPLIAESDQFTIEATASTPIEESAVLEKEISAPESESESEAPEIVTEEPQRSAGTTGEVWGWDPGNEEGHKIADTQEVMDLGSAQSDPVPPPVQSSQESRYVYTQSESQLWEDDYETDEVEQGGSQSTGCSKGCMQKIAATFYVVGVLLMLGGCNMDRGEGGGGVMFFGLILIGIGYGAQKSVPKG